MESRLWSVIVHVGLWVTTPPTAQGCLWQQEGVPETAFLKVFSVHCKGSCLLSRISSHFFLHISHQLREELLKFPHTKRLLPEAQS